MRIAESARRHGVSDEDIRHALGNAMRILDEDDLTMVLGPARTGDPLEVGVLNIEDDPIVVHAMPLRPKYFPYL
jgi:hypothetical protein